MASFRETRELLCISRAMGFITDAEFLLLYEENKADNLDFPYKEFRDFLCRTQMKPSVKLTSG